MDLSVDKAAAVYYRDIVNSLSDAVVIVDARLQVVFANLTYYEFFGVDERETIGRRLFEAVKGVDSSTEVLQILRAVANAGVRIDDYAITETFPIIGERTLSLSAHTLKRDGLNTDLVLITLTDTTEDAKDRELCVDATKQLKAQIIEVNHRVKNNLASVLSMLRLEQRSTSHSETRDILKRISMRVDSIASLYELLAVDSSTGSIQLLSYFRNVCRTIEKLSGSDRLNWSIHVEGDEIPISVDDALNIGAVVNELVANAARYAFEGQEEGGTICLCIARKGDEIEIIVEDNGIGMDAEPSSKSTGLGMKLVEVYLRAISGRMAKTSRAGVGTQYTIRVPYRDPLGMVDQGEGIALPDRSGGLPPAPPAAAATSEKVVRMSDAVAASR